MLKEIILTEPRMGGCYSWLANYKKFMIEVANKLEADVVKGIFNGRVIIYYVQKDKFYDNALFEFSI